MKRLSAKTPEGTVTKKIQHYMRITFLILLFASSLCAQTIIPDSTMVSGNWTLSNSPYIIKGRAIVPAGQTLTIDPGVQVRFASDTSLNNGNVWNFDLHFVGNLHVYGRIIANGTIADTIFFIADSAGYWGSVMLMNGADSTSSFSYCAFKNMNRVWGPGGGGAGLSVFRVNILLLDHLLFENNAMSCGVGLFTLVDHSIFRNNADNGIALVHNSVFDNSPISSVYLTMVNCIVKNASEYAFFTFCAGISECTLINTLVYNNPIVFISGDYNTTVNIYNSIFVNNLHYDTLYNACCPQRIINNCVFDGANNFHNWTTTTINYPNTNPNLVNPLPLNGDFHLQSSSICINNGDTTGISLLIPSTDLDGNPRYVGTIDIGPYEYQGITNRNESTKVKETVIVYPNPAKDKIYIRTNGKEEFAFMYDVYGNKVKSGKNEIDISDLSEGVYFVTVKTTEGVATKKVIVQR
jgi:hypothetical protein